MIRSAIALVVPGLGKELLDPVAAFGHGWRFDNGAKALCSDAFEIVEPLGVGEKTVWSRPA